jgi:FhaA, N-terminal domain/FHA domain
MTRPFAVVEQFFERLFERPAARLFHTPLQPVQLERRLERSMDAGRVAGRGRTYVPHRYRVLVNPDDLEELGDQRAVLQGELAQALHTRARVRGYLLLARPTVALEASRQVQPADVDVVAEPLDRGLVAARTARLEGAQRSSRAAPGPAVAGVTDNTAYSGVEIPSRPIARIEVRTLGTLVATRDLSGGTTRVGRAADNEIVLADQRVSRRHGQLSSVHGALVYRDLESRNGSFVNGARVREIVIGSGDVVRLGNSTLTIQPLG